MKTTISRTAGPTLYTLEPHPIKKFIEQFTPFWPKIPSTESNQL